MSEAILSIRGLRKQYASGTDALNSVDLDIKRGEIFALLGPNGAGKTTLISIICGIVTPSGGEVLIDGKNWQRHFREARTRIGLVPQELTMDVFEPLISTVSFSRELFGRRPDPKRIEEILRELSLWDKRKTILKELSGGMKRRVMIAKALAHDPDILFLDEPTAGVDVELRRDMARSAGFPDNLGERRSAEIRLLADQLVGFIDISTMVFAPMELQRLR